MEIILGLENDYIVIHSMEAVHLFVYLVSNCYLCTQTSFEGVCVGYLCLVCETERRSERRDGDKDREEVKVEEINT